MNFFQYGNANERGERLPVAFCAVVLNRTELKRAERRWAESFLRIDCRVERFGVAHHQRAVGYVQNCRERFVGGGNFDALGARESRRNFTFQEKRNLPIERQARSDCRE